MNLISCRFARREKGGGVGGVGVGWTSWLSFSILKTKNDPTKREPGLSKK